MRQKSGCGSIRYSLVAAMAALFVMMLMFSHAQPNQGFWPKELAFGAACHARRRVLSNGTNQNFNTEEYDRIEDNPFKNPLIDPVSTFSIDVDTASYANVRSYLVQRSELPPKDAVRIEELINYFSYDYPKPADEHPVAAQVAMTTAPWNPAHYLLRVAVKAKTIEAAAAPPSNLVFLIDTSGSSSAKTGWS